MIRFSSHQSLSTINNRHRIHRTRCNDLVHVTGCLLSCDFFAMALCAHAALPVALFDVVSLVQRDATTGYFDTEFCMGHLQPPSGAYVGVCVKNKAITFCMGWP